MFGWPQWIALAISLFRIIELVYSNQNCKRLIARGGKEYGRSHYYLFFLIHTAWIGSIFFFVSGEIQPNLPLLFLFVILQILRVWVILTLGPYWSTRVISHEKFPVVTNGPYRWMKHPNYAIVACEIFVIPLIFGSWAIAIIFSILNAILLYYRINVETRALAIRSN